MNKIKNFIKKIGILSFSLTLAFAIFMGVFIASGAWTEPTEAPTGGNIAVPINTGSTYQEKTASIGGEGSFDGSIGVNDIYISSAGKWVSELSTVTSATYTATGSCDEGDEELASRYESRKCTGQVGEGCGSAKSCTTIKGTWESGTPIAPTCSYYDIWKNDYGNCWTYNTRDCTANVKSVICKASWL